MNNNNDKSKYTETRFYLACQANSTEVALFFFLIFTSRLCHSCPVQFAMHPEPPGPWGASSFQRQPARSNYQMLCNKPAIFQNECVAKPCSPIDISWKPFKSLFNSQCGATAFSWENLTTGVTLALRPDCSTWNQGGNCGERVTDTHTTFWRSIKVLIVFFWSTSWEKNFSGGSRGQLHSRCQQENTCRSTEEIWSLHIILSTCKGPVFDLAWFLIFTFVKVWHAAHRYITQSDTIKVIWYPSLWTSNIENKAVFTPILFGSD